MIVVSSCLIGLKCRYDGKVSEYDAVNRFLKGKQFIPICPEQMGGLTTPRLPAEIVRENPVLIRNCEGFDVTDAFMTGVDDVMKIIDHFDVELAILKSKSPSCGSKNIYDGTFSSALIDGQGMLSRALMNKGIRVVNEQEINEIYETEK